jgi:hypothetical protein
MSEQKRTYSRVEAFFPGRLRLLAPGEENAAYQGCFGCDAAQSAVLRPKGANMPEALLDFLETINSKLDMLLSLANREHLESTFPVAVNIVEISGAGLIFTADREFALDDRLELVLFLSQFPLQTAGAMGRIHRRDDQAGNSAWAVDFTSIREQDREAIVRYVFQQQRERIRESKQWD